mgnify:CR=1 FL=1
MTPTESTRLDFLRGSVLENPLIPEAHRKPHPKQARFLLDMRPEVLFGGSAGGGKSWALLAAALQFVDRPGYSALILRRTYQDLAQSGAIMDRAIEWLRPNPAVRWSQETHTFSFPSGARLSFGYLDARWDHLRYQGTEWAYVAFDELTQFDEVPYRYLFSRLRRLEGSDVPLRMRSASNPGGPGNDWVRARFVDAREPGRGFVRAGLVDNPSLDREAYVASLSHLDPLTRRQLLDGDWTARREGGLFRREWFRFEDAPPEDLVAVARWWDLAAGGADWTVGLKMGVDRQRRYHVLDVSRAREDPAGVEALVRAAADRDGLEVVVLIGEEPGSAGKALVDHYRRNVLPFVRVEGVRETGAKYVRAQPTAGHAAAGNVFLVRGPWNEMFLDELEAFSEDERTYAHDDQVDALSGSHAYLADARARDYRATPPKVDPAEDFERDLRLFGLAPVKTAGRPPVFG